MIARRRRFESKYPGLSKRHLLDIGPAEKWVPDFRPGRGTEYLDTVETADIWWAQHLLGVMAGSDNYDDSLGRPRQGAVPPGLRAAFVQGEVEADLEADIEGDIEGRRPIMSPDVSLAPSRSVLARRSCRVAPSAVTVTSAPSAVSEAKHPKPLREAIDACRVSLLKQARCLMDSVRKKAAGQKHPAVATAKAQDDYDLSWQEVAALNTPHWNDYDGFWQEVAELRVEVAAYWVKREDARLRQEVLARAAAVSKARAAASAGSGEGGSGGPAGAVECFNEYKCPITAEIMKDPVCTADGFTYERAAITEWLRTNDTSPSTGAKLTSKSLIPNISVRCLLQRL